MSKLNFTLGFQETPQTPEASYSCGSWFEGHEGHLALKETLLLSEPTVICSVLCFKAQDLDDRKIVNLIAALSKSSVHIAYILGENFPFDISAWEIYKNNGRQITALMERVSSRMTLSGEGAERVLKLKLFSHPKPAKVVCAVVRRMVNLVDWATSSDLKLVSPRKFKWDTYDLIASKRKYVKSSSVE